MVRFICCKLGDVFGWKCISFLDPWNTVRCWNQLRLLGDVYHFFVWEKQFQELAVRILLHLDIWIQCSHRGIWLSGGRWEVSLKLREICPFMGIRERGRKAISSPVVLRPAPSQSLLFARGECCWFTVGFFTAVIFLGWLLSD